MSYRDYYPAGAADDPNAPYNEVENPEVYCEADVMVVLTNTLEVCTNDYEAEYDPYEGITRDFTYTNFKEAYENGYHSIPDLLKCMADLIREYMPSDLPRGRKEYINDLLSEAEGWEVEELNVEMA